MSPFGGWGFEQDLLYESKKDEVSGGAAQGALIDVGGERRVESNISRQVTSTYSPTSTSVYAPQSTSTRSYAPVYAPSISVIEDSAGASLSKKDTTAGGTSVIPTFELPIAAGGTSVNPSSGQGGMGETSALKSLVNNSSSLLFVGGVVVVGGVILFSRFGNAKNLPRRGGK